MQEVLSEDTTPILKYNNLIQKFLTKDENYDTSKFIGGLPITIEKKNMSSITSTDLRGNSKYVATQKVDGTRILMYIGPDETIGGIKQRVIRFIGRDGKMYMISYPGYLPNINSGEMLLDGEIIFFKADNTSQKWATYDDKTITGISFMAFDILYGPDNIDVNTEGDKITGQSVSMTVPSDGILRTAPWTYINRYDILHKLIVPSNFNKQEPLLTMELKNIDWFNIELKPIYPLNKLVPPTKTQADINIMKPLYSTSGAINSRSEGTLQMLLRKDRDNFYRFLTTIGKKSTSNYTKKPLKLDGLIFTSVDTLYSIGAWNKNQTTQYKWKPPEEQTVDLQIIKHIPDGAILGVKVNKNVIIFKNRNTGSQYIGQGVPVNIKPGSIAEFSIENGEFIYKEDRNDKFSPNSINTVINVINSFENPVIINDLHYFLHMDENGMEDGVLKKKIRTFLLYSSRYKLLRCISSSGDYDLLQPRTQENITELIKDIGIIKDIEVEMRLGKIISKSGRDNFNPNITEESFSKIIQATDKYGLISTITYYLDIYPNISSAHMGRLRTRYVFSPDFKKYILFESVIKTRLSNIDIDMSKIWEHDIRVSSSTERKVAEYNTEGKCSSKKRKSYTDKNQSFRLDFTYITNGIFKNRDFIEDKNTTVTRQFEIEFLKNDVDVREIFKFITTLLTFL